ncbi:MAG: iron-sulfur cluster assembly accessory protein [Actinomycetales bacterium]|nr:iron-sulfur cluster assembly accessory protein [Actinomycetales bacterium]
MSDTSTHTHGVSLTDGAAAKLRELLEQETQPGLRLRVAVRPGGCGVSYQMAFDNEVRDGDQVRDTNGVGVVVDRFSAPFLVGATIGFMDGPGRQGFTIDNPNAGGGGGCCG